MQYAETIIVGGGPAGSSCAWMLGRAGRECLVLESKPMPRVKLCAGWITPKVLTDLEFSPREYPYGIVKIERLRFCFGKRPWMSLTIQSLQYSIRRVEFDDWLLKRSGAPVITHTVRNIERVAEGYRIDGRFECRYLVGAGGSGCPVQKSLFKNQNGVKILAKEVEYETKIKNSTCTLWVPYAGKGYAWHVPKSDGINIGYGGTASSVNPSTLNSLWIKFSSLLSESGYLEEKSPPPSGWSYHLRSKKRSVQVKQGNAYVTGDAAGLATLDLAEGIGPAVESGILAARDILGQETYTTDRMAPYSIGGFFKRQIFSALMRWGGFRRH